MQMLECFINDDSGVSAIEYGLIAALIAVAAIAALQLVGTNLTSTFNMWQQCWTAPNLFAAGEVNNTTGDTVPSGTHIAGPQVQIASEGIQQYLKSPGLLTTPPNGTTGPV